MKNGATIKQIKLIPLLAMFCTLIIVSGLVLVRTVYAEEINIPENASTITEKDFPLTVEGETWYKIVPERDAVIGEVQYHDSDLMFYQEQDGKLFSIDWAYLNEYKDNKLFHVLPGNTYYFYTPYADTLYIGDTVKVTLDSNKGSFADKETIDLYLAKDYNYYLAFNNFANYYNLSRSGYTFYTWNTKPDGGGNLISQYDHYTKDITFYAQWCKNVTVTKDPNGGYYRGNTIDPDTNEYVISYDSKIETISESSPGSGAYPDISPKPIKNGFKFKAWNSKPDGSGKSYKVSEDFNFGPFYEDTTVYATWICADGNHKYGEWKTVKAPSYAAAGSKERTCSECGNIEASTIPKLTVKSTTLSKVTAAKRAFTVKWKKRAGITGYQIQYSLKSNFKGAKTVKITKASTVSKKISKLKAKKNYYVRIRTYKTVKGKDYFSAWSKAKKVKTK